MATEWIYRVDIVVRFGIQAAANQRAREIGIGGGDEDTAFDTVRLSVLGHGEPTDMGCSTLMTLSMLDTLRETADEPAFAGLRYYCRDAELGTLIETNSPNAEDLVGSDWTWEDSLADIGLTCIEPDLPNR